MAVQVVAAVVPLGWITVLGRYGAPGAGLALTLGVVAGRYGPVSEADVRGIAVACGLDGMAALTTLCEAGMLVSAGEGFVVLNYPDTNHAAAVEFPAAGVSVFQHPLPVSLGVPLRRSSTNLSGVGTDNTSVLGTDIQYPTSRARAKAAEEAAGVFPPDRAFAVMYPDAHALDVWCREVLRRPGYTPGTVPKGLVDVLDRAVRELRRALAVEGAEEVGEFLFRYLMLNDRRAAELRDAPVPFTALRRLLGYALQDLAERVARKKRGHEEAPPPVVEVLSREAARAHKAGAQRAAARLRARTGKKEDTGAREGAATAERGGHGASGREGGVPPQPGD